MSNNQNYIDNDCPHENVATYTKGTNTIIKACLDCGYTEISVAGVIVRKYFQAPIIFGIVRRALSGVEDWIKNLKDS